MDLTRLLIDYKLIETLQRIYTSANYFMCENCTVLFV